MKGIILNASIICRKEATSNEHKLAVWAIKRCKIKNIDIYITTKECWDMLSPAEQLDIANEKILAWLEKKPVLKRQLYNYILARKKYDGFNLARVKLKYGVYKLAQIRTKQLKKTIYLGTEESVSKMTDAQINNIIKTKLLRNKQ